MSTIAEAVQVPFSIFPWHSDHRLANLLRIHSLLAQGYLEQVRKQQQGWVIETSLKIDPSTQPSCDFIQGGAVQIWANDHTILVIFGFSTDEICILYPDTVHFPMNTTDSFRIYRIEAKGMEIHIYVDGALAVEHTLSNPGRGTEALVFGDGTVNNKSLTRWDYFSYQVFPEDN